MSDPRYADLAKLLVERSLDVQPGWQVSIRATPAARELVEEICRAVARRGAYALPRLALGAERIPVPIAWAEEAPLELLERLPAIELNAVTTEDARLTILSPERTSDEPPLPPERLAAVQRALEPSRRRGLSLDVRWAVTQFPTEAAAARAGMTVEELRDFIFGASLRDWDAEHDRMRRICDRFDAADEVRIVGHGTDVTVSIAGREGAVDHALRNMPGGEVYFAPLEDSANGVVTYSEFPAFYMGARVEGARLTFRDGVVVEATADHGEDFLLRMLDTDDGSRRLGELGIGCNPGITRAMGNPLFDEKIAGTVHLALGASYTFIGGTNESAIHWDMVKDLRGGGELYADGELVQLDGEWQFGT